ncbi:MAG: mechanosensitive ion channel [Candidatus Lokiarchaeota archaeon]|nr:mechanosensitive ion channel [Candidatus Lokiarchaeota archaeon]
MLEEITAWITTNINQILVSAVAIIVGIIVNRLAKRQLRKLGEKQKIEESLQQNLAKIIRLVIIITVLSAILSQFAEAIGLITSLFTLIGGTIFGFAAINTLGNAIAGLILMISRPFKAGDRILYEEKAADVLAVDFMYTKLKYLDKTVVIVPNQTLMTTSVTNLHKGEGYVRRGVAITVDYETKSDYIMDKLVDVVKSVDGVIENPEPRPILSAMLDYGVEYKCFYSVENIKDMYKIDGRVRKAVLDMCQDNNIDLSMPVLYKKV